MELIQKAFDARAASRERVQLYVPKIKVPLNISSILECSPDERLEKIAKLLDEKLAAQMVSQALAS